MPPCGQATSSKREKGNLHRENPHYDLYCRQYAENSRSYTAALSCPMDDQELLKIRNNRAHANLKLGRFDEALQDAEIALQLFPTDEKALFRASRALYELDRFPESLSYLQRLVERYPDNTAAQKELSRTKLRVEEEKYATFDFRMMLDMVGKDIMSLDCATYVGPVAVKESKGRGRGVFLTRDVKAGELLVCEKACAVEHTSDAESGTMLLVFNINTNRITKGQQASVIAQIVNQLYRNPSKAESITSVYSGSHNTVKAIEVDGEPIVDT
jgi:tetratricopeptide (TPR) repeat protein